MEAWASGDSVRCSRRSGPLHVSRRIVKTPFGRFPGAASARGEKLTVDQGGVEVVARRAIAVGAELDRRCRSRRTRSATSSAAARRLLVEQPGLRGWRPRAPMRWRANRMCTPRARSDWYRPLLSSSSGSGAISTGRWLIITASGSPLAQRNRWIDTTSRSSVRFSSRATSSSGGPDAVVEQLRGRLLAGAGQIVEQAGQLDGGARGSAPPASRLRACAPADPCRRVPGSRAGWSAATTSAASPAPVRFRSDRRATARRRGWRPRSPGRVDSRGGQDWTCRAPPPMARRLRSRAGPDNSSCILTSHDRKIECQDKVLTGRSGAGHSRYRAITYHPESLT